MASDISRDLVVSLKSINLNKAAVATPLLPADILSFVDSGVPEIWLPRDACARFEEALGIVYYSTINRYLVNDTLHQQFQSINFSISFLLQSDTTSIGQCRISL